jgi:hypothetical protein
MQYRLAILVVSLFYSLISRAGEGEFAVSRISPLLLKNANAVVRQEELRFELLSRGKAVLS